MLGFPAHIPRGGILNWRSPTFTCSHFPKSQSSPITTLIGRVKLSELIASTLTRAAWHPNGAFNCLHFAVPPSISSAVHLLQRSDLFFLSFFPFPSQATAPQHSTQTLPITISHQCLKLNEPHRQKPNQQQRASTKVSSCNLKAPGTCSSHKITYLVLYLICPTCEGIRRELFAPAFVALVSSRDMALLRQTCLHRCPGCLSAASSQGSPAETNRRGVQRHQSLRTCGTQRCHLLRLLPRKRIPATISPDKFCSRPGLPLGRASRVCRCTASPPQRSRERLRLRLQL